MLPSRRGGCVGTKVENRRFAPRLARRTFQALSTTIAPYGSWRARRISIA
jgi:hypothetical protein